MVTDDLPNTETVKGADVAAAVREHCSVFEYLPLILVEDRHVVSSRTAEYVVESGTDAD